MAANAGDCSSNICSMTGIGSVLIVVGWIAGSKVELLEYGACHIFIHVAMEWGQ